MVLVLKVYVYRPAKRSYEIRRISVTSDVLQSYEALCCKIAALYPDLTGNQVVLSWKDSDGDDIVMSSNQELDQAIANVSEDHVLKIYVHQGNENASRPAPQNVNEVLHPNVVCDACNQLIKGHRYKCLQCEDFDLCTACNTLDMHPMHDMVKLVSPSSVNRAWFFRGWRSMWQSMFGDQGHRPHDEEHHQYHHHFNTGWKKGKCTRKGPISPNSEILSAIGQSISSLLTPFGVQATVDVVVPECEDSSGSDTTQPKKPAESSEKITTTEAATSTVSPEGPPPKVRKEEPDKVTTTHADVQMDCSSDGNSTTPQASVNKDAPGSASKPRPVPPFFPASFLSSVSEALSSSQHNINNNTPQGLFTSLHEAAKNLHGWTLVNAPNAPEGASSAAAGQAEVEIVVDCPQERDSPVVVEEYPPIVVEPDEPSDIDPRFADVLKQMQAMGFTNEGNMLYKLIQSKDGNVNAVLDVLYQK